MAKSFFAQHEISYTEKDVTGNDTFMRELEELAGRFVTPTLWIDGKTVIGFGMNMPQIRALLEQGGYLEVC